MAFTIQEALSQAKEQYKMTLLAGAKGCNNTISWVHLLEDTTIVNQFWGNELAVTTGLGFSSSEKLFHLIDLLISHRCAGLIINTGKYITDIPDDILAFCNEHNFPLITIPWEIYVADLIRDFCIRTFTTERESQQLARHFIRILQSPENISDCQDALALSFNIEGDFAVIISALGEKETLDFMERQKMNYQLKNFFEKLPYDNCFFNYEDYFVIILNNISSTNLKIMVNDLTTNTPAFLIPHAFFFGIGSVVTGLSGINESYIQAKAALLQAKHSKCNIIYFNEMGINQLFYSFRNKELLISIYQNQLAMLITYDKKHQSNYEDTLYYYLKYNGSIQSIADAMFTHRNTVTYRMNKIKEILGCDLVTTEERFPFELAFYIKDLFNLS